MSYMENLISDLIEGGLHKQQEIESDLSAGICDNCTVPKMKNTGDGINEPPDPVLWCEKMNREICPEPVADRCTSCLFYRSA